MDEPTDAIKEGISQHCIIQSAISNSRIYDLVDYLQQVSLRCVETKRSDMLRCSRTIREEEGDFIMSEESLDTCIQRNLSVENDFYGVQVIQFLEEQKSLSDYYTYRRVPSIFINDELVRGIVEGDLAAGAVCDSFQDRPESCKGLHLQVMKKVRSILRSRKKHETREKEAGVIWVVVSCLIVFMFTYVVFKRMIETSVGDDLENRVNVALNQYHRVKEGDGVGHRPVNVQNTSMETEGGISNSSGESGL